MARKLVVHSRNICCTANNIKEKNANATTKRIYPSTQVLRIPTSHVPNNNNWNKVKKWNFSFGIFVYFFLFLFFLSLLFRCLLLRYYGFASYLFVIWLSTRVHFVISGFRDSCLFTCTWIAWNALKNLYSKKKWNKTLNFSSFIRSEESR